MDCHIPVVWQTCFSIASQTLFIRVWLSNVTWCMFHFLGWKRVGVNLNCRGGMTLSGCGIRLSRWWRYAPETYVGRVEVFAECDCFICHNGSKMFHPFLNFVWWQECDCIDLSTKQPEVDVLFISVLRFQRLDTTPDI